MSVPGCVLLLPPLPKTFDFDLVLSADRIFSFLRIQLQRCAAADNRGVLAAAFVLCLTSACSARQRT